MPDVKWYSASTSTGIAVAAGSGTTNRLMKFDASDNAADSLLSDDGTNVQLTSGQYLLSTDAGIRRDAAGSLSFTDGSTGHATGLGLGTTTPKTIAGADHSADYAASAIHASTAQASSWGALAASGPGGGHLFLYSTTAAANQRLLALETSASTFYLLRYNDAMSAFSVYLSANMSTDVVTLGSASVAGVNYISGTGNHTFSDGDLLFAGANGQSQRWSRATESHTLAAAGTSTTATAVFPASSLGKGASFRITTGITGCTSVQVGVSGDTTRYGTFSTLTAGQTIAISRADNYSAQTGILFTAVGGGASFTAGVIRVEVQYETATAPTS